ncbi:flagellar hook-associated protein FlgK [Helicovermis profundi]|uniref:Flagellar hook-associated protein 1 n=1 Tax=Helicovermis profundi TaxID=3065157 RepID=A0AAU9E7U5_9FIRM|nr:flagellar hook-associated protein FlgK [Clostridia bacterium S502]
MGSTFFGLNIAKSGLFASQRALQVTSHNIANANTEGFSRQRVDMHAFSPDSLPSIQGMIGTGVDTDAIKQIRNEFLDYSFRTENSKMGEWSKKEDILKNIEAIINEPSESGISKIMDQFYSSLQELNKNPESLTTRALVRQRAIALTKGLNNTYSKLEKLQNDTNFELSVAITDINGYAEQISTLNKVIYSSELEGGKANDVRDQRNLLLDKMSELVEINYYEDDQKRFHVSVAGHEIVNHYNHDTLEQTERTSKLNDVDTSHLKDLVWSSGSTFTASSGKIKGITEMRDNISGTDKGIPYYLDKTNEFIDVMGTEINNVHQKGYDLDKNTGTFMFTINGMSSSDYKTYLKTKGFNGGAGVDVTSAVLSGTSSSLTDKENDKIMKNNIASIIDNNPNYKGKSVKLVDDTYLLVDRMKASEVTISSDIENDLNKFEASVSQDGVPGDGNNALKIADVRHNVELFDWGSPDDFIKSLVSNLGVDAQEATRVKDNQKVMVDSVTNSKESYSGVSLDEEMASMVQFQHSYNANAKMLTTVDKLLETIINLVR